MLKLFVYGTLKRGFFNYDRHCVGVKSVQGASLRGRLYMLPPGYPLLEVPESDILAHPSGDPVEDVLLQDRFAGKTRPLESKSSPESRPNSRRPDSWRTISGELMAFDDPEVRLLAIDRLEGLVPGEPPDWYRRVLMEVTPEGGERTTAWVYVSHGTPTEEEGAVPIDAWP